MNPRFSVSDFLAVTNQALEVALTGVEVEGEVSRLTVNHKKFVFFDLKDAGGTVNCFMTVWQLRVALEDGMRVVVRALPKLTDWGKFSLTVQHVQPLGAGDLKRSAELLQQQLAAEGLFDDDRKRPLPSYPRCIAVVSSMQAAGYADFMKIAHQRWPDVRFVVAHVPVQGAQAADHIIRALTRLNQSAEPLEAIALIRGGGSADDLAVFNDERLVRAVASSRLPVITGIGHQTDCTLVDLVADVHAATPSNAAQLLLPDKQLVLQRVQASLLTAAQQVRQAVERQRQWWGAQRALALAAWQQRLAAAQQGMALRRQLIAQYDPEAALRRGYAVIEGTQRVGSIVKITTDSYYMKARIERSERRHHH